MKGGNKMAGGIIKEGNKMTAEEELKIQKIAKAKIEEAAIRLLRTMHVFNKLDKRVVSIISMALNVDANEICERLGITYCTE